MTFRQIDWHSELDAIGPYLAEISGIIHIRFSNHDCAPNQFSSLLKQRFAATGTKENRFSMRVDHDFATTHVAHDILTEFEMQLRRCGYEVAPANIPTYLNMFTDMQTGGNSEINVGSVIVNADHANEIFNERTTAICDALEAFITEDGRFMIEQRDAPLRWQSDFLKYIWTPILSNFVGNGLVYIHMLGPECRQMAHEDAPIPDLTKTLPIGFETDEARESAAYDDLIDIFEDEGHNRDTASTLATAHLNSNLDSVSKLHNNLAGLLLSMKQKRTK